MDANIRFIRSEYPDIPTGYYQVEVQETTNLFHENKVIEGDREVDFIISAKRFSMGEDFVYSCYPPKGSVGDYGTVLPHIVLHDPQAPWRYRIDSGQKDEMVPTMALFVFCQDEGIKEHQMPIRNLRDPTNETVFLPDSFNLSELDTENPDDACSAIDIPTELFLKLCPDIQELQYLTHVREVELKQKESDPQVKEGRFSCLTANRFPKSAKNMEETVNHQVYLVSLIDYIPYLTGEWTKDTFAPYAYVRVITYTKWHFSASPHPYDFLGIIKNIKPDIMVHSPDQSVQDNELIQVLKKGYIPRNHNLRDGSKTVSWYRGPLIPIQKKHSAPHYHIYADEYYYYDPVTGMLDVSYACAWRLGRMVTMQNLSLCKILLEWRLQNSRTAALYHQYNDILGKGKEDSLNECSAEKVKQTLQECCLRSVEELNRLMEITYEG